MTDDPERMLADPSFTHEAEVAEYWRDGDTEREWWGRVFLAAISRHGWEVAKLEQVGSVLDDGDEVHDFRYSSPADLRVPLPANRIPVFRRVDGPDSARVDSEEE